MIDPVPVPAPAVVTVNALDDLASDEAKDAA